MDRDYVGTQENKKCCYTEDEWFSVRNSKVHPDVVRVLVFVLNVNVKTGVVWDVDPTGTAPGVFIE